MKPILLLMVTLNVLFCRAASGPELEIRGNQFYWCNNPVKMWGIRVASASQQEDYTAQLISSLPKYRNYGIRAISVFVQGSSGGFSDPFAPDGKGIDKNHLKRLIRIIKACDKNDIMVIAGIFYQRAMSDKQRKLNSSESVINAVRLITEQLKPYPNVIINIANEQNSSLYKECTIYDFNKPENIISLCREVHLIDKKRIAGGGGYHDESNIAIGKSPEVDVLLFDTWSKDIEENKDSGWKYDFFKAQGFPDKPMINVEIFGGWTQQFIPQGVYPEEGKKIHLREITEAKKRAGLSVHFHSNPWFQGPSIGAKARFDLGGMGTPDDPGISWWIEGIRL